MPVNTIVQFTFYKLVAWFNDKHAHALKLRSGQEFSTIDGVEELVRN